MLRLEMRMGRKIFQTKAGPTANTSAMSQVKLITTTKKSTANSIFNTAPRMIYFNNYALIRCFFASTNPKGIPEPTQTMITWRRHRPEVQCFKEKGLRAHAPVIVPVTTLMKNHIIRLLIQATHQLELQPRRIAVIRYCLQNHILTRTP